MPAERDVPVTGATRVADRIAQMGKAGNSVPASGD